MALEPTLGDVTESLVSVVIPTKNRSKLVLRAIQSVLGQTYNNIECIVVDDGSKDNTEEVVRSIKDSRVLYIQHKESKKASAARNSGIKCSRGEYVAFLDDDDVWRPRKIEKQILLINSLPKDFGMVYCWMNYYDQSGNIIKEHHPELRGDVFIDVIDFQRIGGAPTLFLRKEVFKIVGYFDETLPRGNDGDFIRRVCRKYMVDFVPEVLVDVYTEHGYERISDSNRCGLFNAILGQEAKLKKFKAELDRLPMQKANIYASIAGHYFHLKEWRAAFRNCAKAISTYPFNLTIYKKIIFDSFFLIRSYFK